MTDDAIIKMLATHPLEAHAHIAWEQALALRSIAESLAKLANPNVATSYIAQKFTDGADLVKPARYIHPAQAGTEIHHPSQGVLPSDVNRDAGRTS